MSFKDLKLIDPIQRALSEKGYTSPTDIQSKAIPEILKRKDILGCAQTGTGKTAAFAIPIIQLIHLIEAKKENKPAIRSLIVTPTRELAIQIGENISQYGKFTKVRHTVIFGGVKQGKQVEALKKGVHILVATPGRLLDLIGQGFISLDTVKIFVLDEADRMLDMGFVHDVKKLVKLLPEKRQSLFFSATLPQDIIDLSKTITNDPVSIAVTPISSTAETVEQFAYYTNRDKKVDLLLHILEQHPDQQALIFTRTKYGADKLSKKLYRAKVDSAAIHGDKAQNHRQKVLKKFKEGDLRTLIATDIAARGIDINKLQLVINYEIPNLIETYIHRIGRSGRAGESGKAVSMCEPEENIYLKKIQKFTGNKVTIVDDNPFPQTDKPMTEEEKREHNKEKQRRKQEFFANRKANKHDRGRGQKSKPKAPSSKKSHSSTSSSSPKPSSSSSKSSSSGTSNSKTSSSSTNSKHKSKSTAKDPNKRRELPKNLKKKMMWPLD